MGQANNADFQTWMDIRSIYEVNEKLIYDGNYGLRGIFSSENWRRYFINPSIVYYDKINLRYRGGLRIIYTEEYASVNTFELRSWQGISINWPQTSYFTINNYFRTEERITFYSNENDTDFALRIRYRIQAKTPTITLTAINQRIYFLANFEIFINLGKAIAEKFVNRNRLSLGMGFYFTNDWWFELIYIRQGSRQNSEQGFITREHILRFRLRYRLN